MEPAGSAAGCPSIVCSEGEYEKFKFVCSSILKVVAYISPVYCESVHKTSILYKYIQNQFTVQVFTKLVNCTSVHKTSLWYKCTQNQFTVQVYTKPVHCASVHKISLLYKFTQNQFTG